MVVPEAGPAANASAVGAAVGCRDDGADVDDGCSTEDAGVGAGDAGVGGIDGVGGGA